MADKSRDAFRTISEVADWLDVPTHVLRFWESRFSQIKPVKRAGGRRYYRPSDMRVIGGVKVLLHDQGMTIRGVQKLFREEGIKHVSSFAPDLFDADEDGDEIAPVLNEAALEAAVRPAAPALSTRDATPAPRAPAAEEQGERVTSEPVFHHSRTVSRSIVSEPSPKPPAPAAKPMIPATPHVPSIDPGDADPAHARIPGLAARLLLKDPAWLVAHRDELAVVRDRVHALLERSE